jgi:hypothetical protein
MTCTGFGGSRIRENARATLTTGPAEGDFPRTRDSLAD